MQFLAFLDQIFFVIVLYKQKPEESSAYKTLRTLSSFHHHSLSLFIYDNSPEPAAIISSSSTIYHHDPGNSGVSKAYNEAAWHAETRGKKWLLLLDQDTQPQEKFEEAFWQAVVQHPGASVFVPKLKDSQGFLSPFQWSMGRGKRIDPTHHTLRLDRFRFVNSGLLIKLDTFRRAKGYDENIPLDFSDIAFGEKLRTFTPHFVVVDSVWEQAFSATSAAPVHEVFHRFRFFCSGAFHMAKVFSSSRLVLMHTFIRSVRLSLIHRKISFVKIFLRHVFNG